MNNQSNIITVRYQIVLYGENKVGTTSLIRRYIYNTFSNDYNYSYYNDYYSKRKSIEDGKDAFFNFIDIHKDRRISFQRMMFRRTDGVMLTYDTTNRYTFLNIVNLLDEILSLIDENEIIPIALVGCKKDYSFLNEEITREEAEKFADELGLFFYETSAKDNYNVEECFNDFTNKLVQMRPKDKGFSLKRRRVAKRGCLK